MFGGNPTANFNVHPLPCLESYSLSIGMLFFRPRLDIVIFPPILSGEYSCIILVLYFKKKEFIRYFLQIVNFFCAVYYRYVFHVPFIELSLALNIWL